MLRRQGKKRERAEARRTNDLLLKAETISRYEEEREEREAAHRAAYGDICPEDYLETDPWDALTSYWPDMWEYSHEPEWGRWGHQDLDKKFDSWSLPYRAFVQWQYDHWAVWLRGPDKTTLPETMTLPQVQQYAWLLLRLEAAASSSDEEDHPF